MLGLAKRRSSDEVEVGAPKHVDPGHTHPQQVVQPHLQVPRAWIVRGGLAALLLALGAGGHEALDRDIDPVTREHLRDFEALTVRVDSVSASLAAHQAADAEDRERLTRLEARADSIEDDNRARDRLMLANLDVMVVGLRDISERLAALEARGGGKSRPMPEELRRGLNDLDLDRVILRRRGSVEP